jgi:ferric-dicitrate binding protein FerR (iron transport regulator)
MSRIRRNRRRRLVVLLFVVSIALSFAAGAKVGARSAISSDPGRYQASVAQRRSETLEDLVQKDRASPQVEESRGIGPDGNTQLK